MKRTGDPNDDEIRLHIGGRQCDARVIVTDVDGLTSYRIPFNLGVLGDYPITLDLFHPDDDTEPRRIPLHPTQRELADARRAIAKLVGNVAMGREQPSLEVLNAIATEVLAASGWVPPTWARQARPRPTPIRIIRDPEPPSLVQRLRQWSQGR